MTDDTGFVERPVMKDPLARPILERLIETEANGKAITIPRNCSGYSPYLRLRGYRLRQSGKGAPHGYVFAWTEKIPETTK